jgi:hypothetical protein
LNDVATGSPHPFFKPRPRGRPSRSSENLRKAICAHALEILMQAS